MTLIAPKVLGLHRDQWHGYSWNGGERMVGVTTPLKIQDTLIGGDLARWGGEQVYNFMADQPEYDLPDREEALAVVRSARDIGTEVHDQVAHILLGEPVTPTDRTAPYIYSFSAFLAKERPEFIAVEQMVANLTHRFGGTFDFAALLRGRVSLVDIKSGKAKPSQRLQLAGYAAAEFMGKEGDPNRYPLPAFEATYILFLRPDGYELVELPVTQADRDHFLYLVDAYHRIREWEKR